MLQFCFVIFCFLSCNAEGRERFVSYSFGENADDCGYLKAPWEKKQEVGNTMLLKSET